MESSTIAPVFIETRYPDCIVDLGVAGVWQSHRVILCRYHVFNQLFSDKWAVKPSTDLATGLPVYTLDLSMIPGGVTKDAFRILLGHLYIGGEDEDSSRPRIAEQRS